MTVSRAELPATHQAVRDLASRNEPSALTALKETAAQAQDQFVRRLAIEVIGGHPRGREMSAVIFSALGDASEYVVRAACDVVGKWKLNEAHDAIATLLTNPLKFEPTERHSGLGRDWLDADVPVLFHMYKDDDETDVRWEAAWVLRHRVGPDDWRAIFDALHVDELPRHRQWASELAAAYSGRDVLPVLDRLCSDSDGHVGAAAARAIQHILHHQ
jgi:HEAT repeat protein